MKRQVITMQKSKNLSIDEAFSNFIKKSKIRNLSDKTLNTYHNHYKVFSELIDNTTPIADVTSDTLDDFIVYLREQRKVNDVTVNTYLRTLRAFLYYCMDCGYMKAFKIKMPKVEKKIKETYTNDELERLLKKPDVDSCGFAEFKTWVFENYLLGTGNRVSTALNVHIRDVDFTGGTITLRKTKSRKQQIIPLSATLSDILSEYLAYRGGEGEDYLFCNNYGEQASVRTYQDLVKKYNRVRNVNKTSIHLFRHTFAKNWILAGGDVFRLQKILGHSDLTVTREYVNMFGQDLQMDFEKFNPLDKISKSNKTIIRM